MDLVVDVLRVELRHDHRQVPPDRLELRLVRPIRIPRHYTPVEVVRARCPPVQPSEDVRDRRAHLLDELELVHHLRHERVIRSVECAIEHAVARVVRKHVEPGIQVPRIAGGVDRATPLMAEVRLVADQYVAVRRRPAKLVQRDPPDVRLMDGRAAPDSARSVERRGDANDRREPVGEAQIEQPLQSRRVSAILVDQDERDVAPVPAVRVDQLGRRAQVRAVGPADQVDPERIVRHV